MEPRQGPGRQRRAQLADRRRAERDAQVVPEDDWITWESDEGLLVVSATGSVNACLSTDQWLAHTWSRDGSEIIGIHETDD